MASKGGNYGIHCTIWHPDISEAWMYCHLSSNRVYIDQEIPPVYPIGTMGATGNVTGAHLHINRFQVDPRGYRLNKDNGYLGGIDPLPFLTQETSEPTPEPMDDSKKKAIEDLDAYRSLRQQGPEGNYEGYVSAIVGSDRDIVALRGQIAGLDDQINQLNKAHENEIKDLKEQWEKAKDTEISQINADWQKKVESATLKQVNEASFSELLNAILNKIFKGGDKNA